MAKYLVQGNYSVDGIKGVLKEGGSGRRQAVEQLAASMGGSVESFYYAFGESDFAIIVDMPDHASMTAVSMIVGASGAVSTRTTVLLTAEEVDAAATKTPDYRPPGA